jgi:CRISPR/Cas system-associated protein Csx1
MDITQIKKEVDAQASSEKPESLKSIAKKSKVEKPNFEKRVKNITIKYQFDDNEKSTTLTSKIMDHEARGRYERVISQLSSGMSFDNLPVEVKNRHFCMARLVCQCVEPEEWVLKTAGEDLEFLFAIAEKLLEHEARYFRDYDGKNTSEEKRSRFSID